MGALGGQLGILLSAVDDLDGVAEPTVHPIEVLEWRRHVNVALDSVLAILSATATRSGVDCTEDYLRSVGWLLAHGLPDGVSSERR